MKIGRNQKCPCGSGLKYKKCCLKKELDDLPSVNFTDFQQLLRDKITKKEYPLIDKFLLKNDYQKALKTLAYLQLLPQNHTKNVRLELIIHNILSSKNLKEKRDWNVEGFKDLLDKEYSYHEFEDPAEGFFTENLLFINGNNIVYSGIANDTGRVVQALLNASLSSILPNSFKKDVSDGSLLILEIHNEIAKSLGHTHRMYEEVENDLIYFPEQNQIKKNSELFSFSQNDIDQLCNRLKIPNDIINCFTCTDSIKSYFEYENEESPLLTKPFLKIQDTYYLVLPSSQLFCLNEYIISKAKEHLCLEILVKIFSEELSAVTFTWLHKAKWRSKKVNFLNQVQNESSYLIDTSLFEFDDDKLALALFVTEPTKEVNTTLEIDRITHYSNQLIKKVKNSYPKHKILLFSVYQKYRMLKKTLFGLNHNNESDLSIGMFMSSLEVLINLWDFDSLTFWKYALQDQKASENGLFINFNNHLSKMNWYINNRCSFNDSDKATPGTIIFDLSTEGEVKRKGLKKIDEIGIPIIVDEKLGFLRCIKKDENLPIYISYEFVNGRIRECLFSYSFPIWVKAIKEIDKKASTYINAILYWLHEIQPSLKKHLPVTKRPLQFIIELDQKIYQVESLEDINSDKIKFSYSFDIRNSTIKFKVPFELIDSLSTANNKGERVLMAFIIDILSTYFEKVGIGNKISVNDRNKVIETHIPEGNKKMILMPTGGDRYGMFLANVDIEDSRYIQEAEKSYILENQLNWYDKKVSEKTIEKDKNTFLNELSFLHLQKAIALIKKYNVSDFLPYIIKKHESLIQSKFFRNVYYPARFLCYKKYLDVKQEFFESEKNLIETSLIYRILIEFTIAENPSGNKNPNKGDLDLILAHLSQVNNYAMMSDEIRYGFQNPRIYILPSGRLGIEKESIVKFNDMLTKVMYGEDFDSSQENFENNFYSRQGKPQVEKDENYIKKIETGFLKDWGISLFDIFNIGDFLCEYSLANGHSYCEVSSEELLKKTSQEFSNQTVEAFIRIMVLETRNGILNFPKNERQEEFYPWRYNRKFSYLKKPLIKLIKDDEIHYAWGPRHMLNSVSNMLHNFYDATLKSDNAPNIDNLIAERLVKKGTEFNNEVFDWLKTNSNIDIIGKDKWIKPKGFFHSSENMGDIDILGIDRSRKVIYSMECKNTLQSKLPYEYYTEIMKYFGKEGNQKEGLIRKHVKRDIWLKKNKILVLTKLDLTQEYSIKSIIITSNFLPSTLIKKPVLDTYSFWEIKKGELFKNLN